MHNNKQRQASTYTCSYNLPYSQVSKITDKTLSGSWGGGGGRGGKLDSCVTQFFLCLRSMTNLGAILKKKKKINQSIPLNSRIHKSSPEIFGTLVVLSNDHFVVIWGVIWHFYIP